MARILVIEDNAVNLELMLYLLRSFGHEAIGELDSRAGLEDASSDGYDLILADLLMPSLDGYELARRIKAERTHVRAPLIAVTAQAMVGDRRRALAAGFDGYIAKPIDPQRFVTQIDSF
jgi:two-component system cell cycle response regulator